MLATNSVGKARARATTIAALAIGLAACAAEDPSSQGACTLVDAPMVNIPTPYSAEPLVRIPQPPGWDRSAEFDDRLFRLVFLDSDSMHPQNVATVVVARLPEPADADPQTILDDMQADMRKELEANNYPTDYVTTETTVCGLPARKHTRAATPNRLGGSTSTVRDVANLQVISKLDGDVYWIQLIVGTQPGNTADEREAEMILNGLQVLPPPNE